MSRYDRDERSGFGGGLVTGLVVGAGAGAVLMLLLFTTPEEMAATKDAYEAERRTISLESAQRQEAAAAVSESGDRRVARADQIAEERAAIDITRPLFLDDDPAPLAAVVIETVPPAVVARLQWFAGALNAGRAHMASQDRHIALLEDEVFELRAAVGDKDRALTEMSLALRAALAGRDLAERRVREYEQLVLKRTWIAAGPGCGAGVGGVLELRLAPSCGAYVVLNLWSPF